ncbi:type IV toxin-antitoxin system AbiEi family antitoxin domain-containing protein [Deinococcus sp. YIM 134068]|uniref:type IV toxin-antitoxin system AbiEi family antitoxin domain-containing protein n=1 Tax=Deinococcus lichenicola TaxID=3118910 RepID=UPI002F95BEFA
MFAASGTTSQRRAALFAVADGQAGYFTAKQAEAAGYSRRMHTYSAQQGAWRHVGHGLYRLEQYPDTPHEPYVQLSLWSRDHQDEPQGVLGFDTALMLHDLSDLMPDRVHLVVPPGFRKRPPPGVVLHRGVLPEADLQPAQGYCLTTPLRTLLDLAGSDLSPEHLHQGLREALERGLVRRRKLEERLGDPTLDPTARRRLLAALENL